MNFSDWKWLDATKAAAAGTAVGSVLLYVLSSDQVVQVAHTADVVALVAGLVVAASTALAIVLRKK